MLHLVVRKVQQQVRKMGEEDQVQRVIKLY